jgi:hypothetical protein
MIWIAAILLVLLFLYAIPAYREHVGGLVLGTSVILISFYFYDKQQRKAAEHVVPLSDIEISDISLYGPLHPFLMNSTLQNNSGHVVETVDLSVLGYDCPGSFKELDHCELIGETLVTLEGPIPPGSVGHYNASVNFDRMPAIKGKFVWQYEITTVRSPLGTYVQPTSLSSPRLHLSNTPR